MQSKPERFGTEYAEAFKDQRVVDLYRYRPPYPAEVFDILAALIADEPRSVLDVGAGSGDIARHLVDFVERVDAVDFSLSMIEHGKLLTNGDHPHLHWIYGKVEEVPLSPPYALITAGVEHSLDGLATDFPALSLHTHPPWLPCPDLSPYLAHALGC